MASRSSLGRGTEAIAGEGQHPHRRSPRHPPSTSSARSRSKAALLSGSPPCWAGGTGPATGSKTPPPAPPALPTWAAWLQGGPRSPAGDLAFFGRGQRQHPPNPSKSRFRAGRLPPSNSTKTGHHLPAAIGLLFNSGRQVRYSGLHRTPTTLNEAGLLKTRSGNRRSHHPHLHPRGPAAPTPPINHPVLRRGNRAAQLPPTPTRPYTRNHAREHLDNA